jgi:hypothetical protein
MNNQYAEQTELELLDVDPLTYYKGMKDHTSFYARSLRVTTCDIMCTTNTAHPYGSKQAVKHSKKSATLPYRLPDILPAFSSGQTDLQLLVNSEAKRKRCQKLKKERGEFMDALHEGRDEAKRLQIYSAIRIQASFRGYRKRRGTIDLEKIMKDRVKNPRLTTSQEIRNELTLWATSIGLKPVVGLSLESTIKKSLHQKKLEAHAASKMKQMLRIAVAFARVRKKRQELYERKKDDAATTVQRFFKYIVFQTKLEGIVGLLKRKGAVQIQTYCRGFLARFRYLFCFLFCILF